MEESNVPYRLYKQIGTDRIKYFSKKVQYNTNNSTGMSEKTSKNGNWYENTF